MADTILTAAINTLLSQTTLAAFRTELAVLSSSEVAAGYQPLDSDLTAIAALTTTSFGRSLLELANAAAAAAAIVNGQAISPGIVTVPAGTAGNPAIISTTGTADTGIFFPAADTMAWSVAGAERFRSAATGLGIGTTSPQGILHINGLSNAAGSAFKLQGAQYVIQTLYSDNANADNRNWALATNYTAFGNFEIISSAASGGNPLSGTTKFTIDKSGNVGIGTASPSVKLHVDGPILCKSYTVATVPAAATAAGQLIYVTDASGGAVHCSSNGSVWKLAGTQTTLT